MDFYHYMMVVYRHCQHTFQYNQLEKVHLPIYDPFNINIPWLTFCILLHLYRQAIFRGL